MASKVMISPEWYRTFFNDLAADFWNGAISEEWTAQETGFLQQAFGDNADTPQYLLDILCGAGRHIPHLSQLGYKVAGVDISEKMLQLARERCQESLPGFQGEFYQLDALAGFGQAFQPSCQFDGAYCLGNSFGYGDAQASRGFLAGIVSHLKPKAKLVLNSAMLAETLLPNWETRMDMVAGGVHAMIENLEYDSQKSRLITRFEFAAEAEGDDGETASVLKESHLVCHYIFTSGEVIRWLEAIGCDCLGIYGGLDKKPYMLGDEQWYGVFRKR